ncbi:Carboxylic ester hydrolase [Coniochaeta hoffmannii]|uniref:Carboxylic ester hydrolase n=1 Tax=Coniochaeta hoffmannii TaxID=91930 RepID=A0AA38SDV2_9PEZI|nr:Carboxylic ester hydrolase [Coniochaeta hoffmannii]
MQSTLAALLAVIAFKSSAEARSCNADLTVQTTGGLVHGKVDSSTPSVRQFLGIPYAQPPVNDLRFAPPQPALPFGDLNATTIGPSCPQFLPDLPSIIINDVPEFNLGGLNTTGPTSEDCLTLSIWAPRSTTAQPSPLPVLIFFYGGAFIGGGVDTPYLLPDRWIQRTQSHIVVSFNHRDNIFGFPNAAGLPPSEQNVGLLDARLAVEWVRDNIASFGGDPSRIGAWGQSSGAVAIAYYQYQYADDPVVNSIILDSGNEFIDILTYDSGHANFTFIASRFGCGGLSPAEELSCMRGVDAGEMEQFMHDYYVNGSVPYVTFSPVVDNVTVFGDYATRASGEGGKIARLPALIGSNAQDGNLFVPYSPGGVAEELADQMTMVYFFCPTYKAAQARIAAGAGPVYRYLYAGNFSNVSPRPWLGAWHGSELPLVFGTDGLYRGESSELERITSWAMQDIWVEFVATAGRNISVVGWERGKQVDGGPVVEFGNGVPARVIDTREMEGRCELLQASGV